VAKELSLKLAYFNELEPIARLFSSPGDSVCLNENFLPMLKRLDECLVFVSAHVKKKSFFFFFHIIISFFVTVFIF